MTERAPAPSPRREELLEKAYAYVTRHGIAELSLRPLAAAVGSSPRVLLFLFGSKDGLVRALLERGRQGELAMLDRVRAQEPADLAATVRHVWRWLAEAEHRPVSKLWLEAYAQSLVSPDGPWGDFGRQTVEDWLAVLADAQPPRSRTGRAAGAERTLALAVLRGALIDLLATGDLARNAAAVASYLNGLSRG
jgi:AcrR family transcriptional regulator